VKRACVSGMSEGEVQFLIERLDNLKTYQIYGHIESNNVLFLQVEKNPKAQVFLKAINKQAPHQQAQSLLPLVDQLDAGALYPIQYTVIGDEYLQTKLAIHNSYQPLPYCLLNSLPKKDSLREIQCKSCGLSFAEWSTTEVCLKKSLHVPDWVAK
jgi:hypothetical protein